MVRRLTSSEVAGPQVPQGLGEALAGARLGWAQLEHQQGDGDGEHAVAEGLQPSLVTAAPNAGAAAPAGAA